MRYFAAHHIAAVFSNSGREMLGSSSTSTQSVQAGGLAGSIVSVVVVLGAVPRRGGEKVRPRVMVVLYARPPFASVGSTTLATRAGRGHAGSPGRCSGRVGRLEPEPPEVIGMAGG